MTHCNNGHPEICYWEDECPLCAANEKHATESALQQEKISMLKGTVEDQQNRIEQYRTELGL
jgi:hypothetical protein